MISISFRSVVPRVVDAIIADAVAADGESATTAATVEGAGATGGAGYGIVSVQVGFRFSRPFCTCLFGTCCAGKDRAVSLRRSRVRCSCFFLPRAFTAFLLVAALRLLVREVATSQDPGRAPNLLCSDGTPSSFIGRWLPIEDKPPDWITNLLVP